MGCERRQSSRRHKGTYPSQGVTLGLSTAPADAWRGCRRSSAARRPPIWAAFEARMFEHGTPATRPRALVRVSYEW